jgi:hypothetical protein
LFLINITVKRLRKTSSCCGLLLKWAADPIPNRISPYFVFMPPFYRKTWIAAAALKPLG